MDMTTILEFLYEHFGEIALGLEFALFNILGKKDPDYIKQKRLEKEARRKAKLIEKKEKAGAKALEKANCTMQEIEQLKLEV